MFKRAIIQHFPQQKTGELRPGFDYAEPLKILQAAGVEINPAESVAQMISLLGTDPKEHVNTIVIGDWSWSNAAVRAMKLPPIVPPDYPKCLEYLLNRKMGTALLKDMPQLVDAASKRGEQIFIKPADDAKAFSGIVEPKDQMLDCFIHGIPGVLDAKDPKMKVYWSEVVEMGSEYRVYIVEGEVVAVCKYLDRDRNEQQQQQHSATTTNEKIDMNVILGAVEKMKNDESLKDVVRGCSMDVTTIARRKQTKNEQKEEDEEKVEFVTTLIECNEGMSLGRYEGLSWEKYTALICSRWKALVSHVKQ